MSAPEETSETLDVLAPWGTSGPPPVGEWRRDILGKGFESQTIPLHPDEEGDNVATLVRHLPLLDPEIPNDSFGFPHFTALYLHGRNDYFFNREIAREITKAGGTFYALDLRKYGRSLRPWQTIGFIDDLNSYDEDLSGALDIINEEVGHLPLVLIGHSTGGLIATTWTNRHPGAAAGLILNSAWLEMHTMASLRSTVQPVLGRIASRNPLWEVPSGEPSLYTHSLHGGWVASGLELPERLQRYEGDPAIVGWDFHTEWKRFNSYPVYAQWLDAILVAQESVATSMNIECPVLSMAAKKTTSESDWCPEFFCADMILDVDAIVERSAKLGSLVTIARFDGRHDLFLSDPDIRSQVWTVIDRWLTAWQGR